MATAALEKPADKAAQKKSYLKTDQLLLPGQKSRVFHAIASTDQTLEDFLRPDFYKNTNGVTRLAVGDRIDILASDLTWEASVRVVAVSWTGHETELRLISQTKHAPATVNTMDAADDYRIEDHKMEGFRVRRVADGKLMPGVWPSYSDARAYIQKDLRIKRVG